MFVILWYNIAMERRPNPFVATCNDMFYIAFELECSGAQEKVEMLGEVSRRMGDLLLAGKDNTPISSGESLKAAAMLACMPSLVRVATGKEHTVIVANEVSDNLQDLAKEIERSGMARDSRPNVVGVLSEISVLASIWWSIANGYFDSNSYAVLTDTKRDSSDNIGLRNGVDIVFKQGGKKPKKHLIQVKSSKHNSNKGYAPCIKVITPTDLTEVKPPKTAHPNTILSHIRTGNSLKLGLIATKALDIF